MTATPFPLPRETRETAILVGNGTVGPYGPTAFKVFDTLDVEVWTRDLGATGFSKVAATVTKTSALALDTVSVTFAGAQPPTTQIVISARRISERSLAVTKAGTIDTVQLEKELSKQASVLEEVRRDINRALQADFGVVAPRVQALTTGKVPIIADGNVIVDGPDASQIALAQSYAASAAASAASIGAVPRGRVNFFDFLQATRTAAERAQITAGTFTGDLAVEWQQFRDALAVIRAGGGRPRGVIPECKIWTSVAPNFAIDYLDLFTDGKVRIRAIGAIPALLIDGHGLGTGGFGVREMHVGSVVVETQTGAQGAYIREIEQSTFDPMLCLGAVTTGIHIDGCVSTIFRKPTCSNQLEAFLATPAVGLRVTGVPGFQTSWCLFEMPTAEGVPIGAKMEYAIGNTLLSGAAEGCSNYGLWMTADARFNKLKGSDTEVNSTGNIYCEGSFNQFDSIDSIGGQCTFATATCFSNRINAGNFFVLNFDANTSLNLTEGVVVGTLNDLKVAGSDLNRHRNMQFQSGQWRGDAYTAISIATEPVENALRTWANNTGNPVLVLIEVLATSVFYKTGGGLRYDLGAGGKAVTILPGDKVQIGWASLPDVRYRFIS